MAVGLASKFLKGNFFFDSAGINTSFGREANPKAIDIMENEFGINIREHRTKDIEVINLDSFDVIVAMDQYVFDELIRKDNFSHKIIYWDIEDPFGSDYRHYKKCAMKIKRVIISQFR